MSSTRTESGLKIRKKMKEDNRESQNSSIQPRVEKDKVWNKTEFELDYRQCPIGIQPHQNTTIKYEMRIEYEN